MKLFVDTSAWVAYYDVSDRWHAFAFDHHFEQAGFRIWPGMVS